MIVKRAIVDVYERLYSDDMQEDWTEHRIAGFDATDLLIELFGESGAEVPSFASEPHEFGQIGEMLRRDGEIDFNAELDPDFDLLGLLREGLTAEADDEEIIAAWKAWRSAILGSGAGDLWSMRRWEQRAGEMDDWLREGGVTSDALLPLMTSLTTCPAAMDALVRALRGWQGDPIQGLRTTRAIVDGLQAPGSGS